MNDYMSFGKRPNYGEDSNKHQWGEIDDYRKKLEAIKQKYNIAKNLQNPDLMSEAIGEANEAAKDQDYYQERANYMNRPKLGEQTQEEAVRDKMRLAPEGFHEYMKTMYSLSGAAPKSIQPTTINETDRDYILWLRDHGFDRYGNSLAMRKEKMLDSAVKRPYMRQDGKIIENPNYMPKHKGKGYYSFEQEY